VTIAPAATAPLGERRDAHVDWFKAIAILAVVSQHALTPYWNSWRGAADQFLEPAVHFHVSVFLFASGFLTHSAPAFGARDLAKRLARILPPYVIASLVIELGNLPGRSGTQPFAFALLIGNVLAIYYFVFLLVACLLLTWPLSRLSERSLLAILGGLLAYMVAFPQLSVLMWGPLGAMLWGFRDPGAYYAYFLAGWLARPHWRSIVDWVHARRAAAVPMAAVTAILYCGGWWLAAPFMKDVWCITRVLYVASVLGLIIAMVRVSPAPAWVRALSDATYPIYLYHYPVMLPAIAHMPNVPGPVRIAIAVAVGLGATLGGVSVLRRVLGRWSRVLVGA
jgi:peptidoglycan/LPS O-acetylase OafA/YrhL